MPAVPNFRDVDPELGALNLSKGGLYPVRYALRLAAGFGSQISMMLLRWTPVADGRRRRPEELGYDYRIADRQPGRRGCAASQARTSRNSRSSSATCAWWTPGRRRTGGGPRSPSWSPTPVAAPAPVAPRRPSRRPRRSRPAPRAARAGRGAGATAPAAPADDIAATVLEIVAAQTGYPADMLDPELDLEADLGIDTVKQAEMFAAIRERYGIARDDNLKLRDYPTLRHVVGFVEDRTRTRPRAPAVARRAAWRRPAARARRGPPPAAPRRAPTDEITAAILEIVAAQTGYPADMLDPELDLEADLGIDTVKQAEMFAAIRERYGIDRDDNLKLRDYPTLRHVVGFVEDRTPSAPAARRAAAATPPPTARAGARHRRPARRGRRPRDRDGITAAILEIVAAQTGYPADMLDPELDLEADLGIDTVKQAEMFAAIRERYGIARDDNLKLRDYPTLRHVVGFVEDRTDARPARPPSAAPSAEPAPAPRRTSGGVPAARAGAGAAAAARAVRADRDRARRGQPA